MAGRAEQGMVIQQQRLVRVRINKKTPCSRVFAFFLVRCVLNLPLKKQIKLRTSLSIKELWGKNPLKCENPP